MGLASLVACESERTMSWNVDVDVSSLYTDASNKSLPEDLRPCCLRSELNRPVAERKSGIPADTEIPAPAITTIFLFLFKTSMSFLYSGPSAAQLLRSNRWVVRSLGCDNFRFLLGGPSLSLEGGVAMFRGSGEGLAEETLEGELPVEEYERRRPARVVNSSGGGEGELERIERSESSESEADGEVRWEGASLKGELVERSSSIIVMGTERCDGVELEEVAADGGSGLPLSCVF